MKRPYWLAGTEGCEACTLHYVREMEFRCVACDRALCVHCVLIVRETREWFCRECGPHAGES
jgi:hypothetical protein